MTACFLQNEPTSLTIQLSKPLRGEGIAKASVNSANLSNNEDPKPDELAMSRMNPCENEGEVRTGEMCNPLR